MFYERCILFCFGEKPHSVKLIRILFVGIIVISSFFLSSSRGYANNLITIVERDLDIKPFFDISDKKLRRYANSYFNIITTYHGSFVSIDRYSNFIIIERAGLIEDGEIDLGIHEKLNFIGLDFENYESIEIGSGDCFVYLSGDRVKIKSSAIFIDSSISFSQKIRCLNITIARSLGVEVDFSKLPDFLIQPITMYLLELRKSCMGSFKKDICINDHVASHLRKIINNFSN